MRAAPPASTVVASEAKRTESFMSTRRHQARRLLAFINGPSIMAVWARSGIKASPAESKPFPGILVYHSQKFIRKSRPGMAHHRLHSACNRQPKETSDWHREVLMTNDQHIESPRRLL